MESNVDADVDDLKAQKKDLEETVQPIISKIYQGSAPPSGAGDEDAEHDEL